MEGEGSGSMFWRNDDPAGLISNLTIIDLHFGGRDGQVEE